MKKVLDGHRPLDYSTHIATKHQQANKMQITKSIIGTGITQYSMTAAVALEIGLLTDGAAGCKWFAEWAAKSPADAVHLYTFGGFIGGFIYNEVADFETLAEFAQTADDAAAQVWREMCAA